MLAIQESMPLTKSRERQIFPRGSRTEKDDESFGDSVPYVYLTDFRLAEESLGSRQVMRRDLIYVCD